MAPLHGRGTHTWLSPRHGLDSHGRAAAVVDVDDASVASVGLGEHMNMSQGWPSTHGMRRPVQISSSLQGLSSQVRHSGLAVVDVDASSNSLRHLGSPVAKAAPPGHSSFAPPPRGGRGGAGGGGGGGGGI